MSTRSFTGTVDAEGQFKARYVHSDGYPTHMASTLAALVEREGGVERVIRTITQDHYGWSSLDAQTPDIEGVRANANATWGTPAKQAALFRGKHAMYGDGRFANVPGWGVAYTTVRGQSSPDEWVEGGINFDTAEVFGLEDTWCEWGYIFDTEGQVLHVIEVATPEGKTNASGTVVASIPVADLPQTAWDRVECGQNYERCGHYAWVHDKSVPEESHRITMRQWLGLAPMTPDYATAVEVDGERFTLTGSGCTASYSRSGEGRLIGTVTSRTDWVASGKAQDGTNVRVVTKDSDGAPKAGVTFIYPPTKAEVAVNA